MEVLDFGVQAAVQKRHANYVGARARCDEGCGQRSPDAVPHQHKSRTWRTQAGSVEGGAHVTQQVLDT